MPETDGPAWGGQDDDVVGGNRSGIDSRFRLVLVAAQRSKQLQRGARPRVAADPKRRRPTSIALEEVRQGLVSFVKNMKDAPREGADSRVLAQDVTTVDV